MRYRILWLILAGLVLPLAAFAVCYDDEALWLTPEEIGQRRVRFQQSEGLKTLASTPQKITTTVDGIVFDSNYDNGSLFGVSLVSAGVFNCSLYAEPGELGTKQYWFRFTMTGVAGRTITLNISHGDSPRPAVRIGGGPWRTMTATEAPSTNRVVLAFGASENVAEVAFFYPLGVQETYRRVAQLVSGCVYASTQVIGQSYQGRDLWMVTVNDTRYPDAGKHRVWVHSRAHAGEVTSTWTMLGILQRATENSALGAYLRRHFIFNIVPLENVDGVWLGHTRWDSQGIDPERQWPNPSRIPEVYSLYTQVNAFMATGQPIEVALNLHSSVGNFADTFFFKHLSPSVTAAFVIIQQNYIDAFNNATILFNNLNPQTSQLDPSIFIESYFWNHWREAVMAITYEGHYRTRITDGQYITGEDYFELGLAHADGLLEYFDLPGPSDFRGWQAY